MPNITYFYMTTDTFADTIDSMSDEELVANMRQSVKDIRANNVDGDSFGASMLRSAMKRSNSRRAEASRANGRLGGRPKGSKNKKTLEREAAQMALETASEAEKASDPSMCTTTTQNSLKEPLKCQPVGTINIEHHGICECPEECNNYSGFHRRPLKKYTALDAHYLARRYGTDCFWCQYGDCWHVGSSRRWR